MANVEEVKNKFNEFMTKYPKSFMILRNESDVAKMDFDKMMKGTPPKDFANTDDQLLIYISQCLQEGKDVSLVAAGSNRILVTACKGLFKN
ncbi:MAG: hypothetical protein COW71_13575 [Ignavibacteriales bacterium CG18_big_fil_WC_8_21_14_2_50_31_20]|nr:MAG: hypothetical protein COW71_13575 [Ignavibacteriales bacterium CG18_big_fil_WC_8_21_14_2_50_31_20]